MLIFPDFFVKKSSILFLKLLDLFYDMFKVARIIDSLKFYLVLYWCLGPRKQHLLFDFALKILEPRNYTFECFWSMKYDFELSLMVKTQPISCVISLVGCECLKQRISLVYGCVCLVCVSCVCKPKNMLNHSYPNICIKWCITVCGLTPI